ncbi:hypothetical protein QTG54_010297 [Skeletonema marinoi]|uniref:Uncharacterized protein n=1 Tax=Skeletonema marinoi TaxID=267567 RepID=A0AAD8Y3H3_9STRA|nr:hypothetical protein QTG54_010297 [Skeletonema marinoi]
MSVQVDATIMGKDMGHRNFEMVYLLGRCHLATDYTVLWHKSKMQKYPSIHKLGKPSFTL